MAESKVDSADKPPKLKVTVPNKTYGFPDDTFDSSRLPDFDTEFLSATDLEAFIQALAAPDPLHSPDDAASRSPGLQSRSSLDLHFTKRASTAFVDDSAAAIAAHAAAAAGTTDLTASPQQSQQTPNGSSSSMFISAKNDWAPIHEKVAGRRTSTRRKSNHKRRKQVTAGRRTKDETREGYLYGILKWPFLFFVVGWVLGLALLYLITRGYVALYEQCVTWRGRREKLRREMRESSKYQDWVAAARNLDNFLGNAAWKEENEFAYYDYKTVKRVESQLARCRVKAEAVERELVDVDGGPDWERRKPTDDLRALVEACVKNNFVGVESPRLYSQTHYGTKNLVQNFVDEVEKSVGFLMSTKQLEMSEKRILFKRLNSQVGRTALCLSGGASFAYYHFGVVKALLDEDLLPDVITGTSGGALVAALVATRTNEELKELLVPGLAGRITACSEPMSVWIRRWWKTGARFDSVDWAKQCSWWTRGSMTFREAFQRTGRVLNVSCVPADPHSPTLLCNYLTSPDCVIWSAVLASAAVPGILNPVVLMMKTSSGTLVPYSFGHKWKDGSLRTDIPIKALNTHFNVNFTIVSQVNPHVNLFFFSSRGSVGMPVTHRKGRGWRGGYLGSALEQYIKLDLTKWLKVLRHLELLPRPLGQDWSQLWLQQFSGTITIWPRSVISDFWRILSDPDPPRMGKMLHEGAQSAFPKLKFISNRLRIERLVEKGRLASRPAIRKGSIETIVSEDDLKELRNLLDSGRNLGSTTATSDSEDEVMVDEAPDQGAIVDETLDREEAIVDDDVADPLENVEGLGIAKPETQ